MLGVGEVARGPHLSLVPCGGRVGVLECSATWPARAYQGSEVRLLECARGISCHGFPFPYLYRPPAQKANLRAACSFGRIDSPLRAPSYTRGTGGVAVSGGVCVTLEKIVDRNGIAMLPTSDEPMASFSRASRGGSDTKVSAFPSRSMVELVASVIHVDYGSCSVDWCCPAICKKVREVTEVSPGVTRGRVYRCH